MCPTILEILSNVKSDRGGCVIETKVHVVCAYIVLDESSSPVLPPLLHNPMVMVYSPSVLCGGVEGVVARLAERLVQGRVPISCGCGCGTVWVFPPPSVGIWGGLRGSGR